MTKPYSLWHYEYNPSNEKEPWRVADVDDDFVACFKQEEFAQICVREHNAVVTPNKNWKY